MLVGSDISKRCSITEGEGLTQLVQLEYEAI
jgi:hypothetical protein